MKKIIIILVSVCFLFFILISNAFAQSPIIGKWVNDYKSELIIESYNPQLGLFSGKYTSSTGASGTYAVTGYSPTGYRDDKSPITFSIYWKSLNGGGGDTPDQQWTSTMTGSFMVTKEGENIMQVFHSLNASLPLDAVEIDDAGRYVETLVFHLVHEEIPELQKNTSDSKPALVENDLVGFWGSGNVSDYLFDITSVDTNGLLTGLCSFNGAAYLLTGYTTATSETDIRSVSMNFMDNISSPIKCFSVNGFLDVSGEATLKLVLNESKSVSINNNYSGVRVLYKKSYKKISSTSKKNSSTSYVTYRMNKIPFTNNGSAEWVAPIWVGLPKKGISPILKFGMDTGGNFIWLNSTQCLANPCVNYDHVQFNPDESSSFYFLDKTPHKIDWGPWGSAMANSGRDILGVDVDEIPYMDFKLITDFSDTPQFQEFLWDGAIAFPADSEQTLEGVSNFLEKLVNEGELILDTDNRISVSFGFNHPAKTGQVTIGSSYSPPFPIDESSKLIFKQSPYSAVPYLWASSLKSFYVGDQKITDNDPSTFFSFDTGSSALKGDSAQMAKALSIATEVYQKTGAWPNLEFEMGLDKDGKSGKIVIGQEQYVQFIEKGQEANTRQPQIQTLSGTPGLYLQGTTLLGYVYSVFWYHAEKTLQGTYRLIGDEVWLYNYQNGPKIIQSNSKSISSVNSEENMNIIIYPNPTTNHQITIKFYLPKKSYITVFIYDVSDSKIPIQIKEYGMLTEGEQVLNLDLQNDKNTMKKTQIIHLVRRLDDGQIEILAKKKIIIK